MGQPPSYLQLREAITSLTAHVEQADTFKYPLMLKRLQQINGLNGDLAENDVYSFDMVQDEELQRYANVLCN